MRLKEFLALEEVEAAEGNFDALITGLSYDSRQVGPGHIFFAIVGEKLDGHEFVQEAINRGAAAVVIERAMERLAETSWVRVRNVRRTMGVWGAHFFGRPSGRLKLVGVTGTNGKTTVSYLVESILSAAGLEPGLIGTINYRYAGREVPSHHTTPESLDLESLLADMARAGVKSVAMEVSSHALAQERVRGLDFDVAVFTNLSRDHLDYHGDMETYFSAKSKLFTDHLKHSAKEKKLAVIYGEDPRGQELLSWLAPEGFETWSYGERGSRDVFPLGVECDVHGLRGKLNVKGQCMDFTSPLIGRANLQNILGAAGVGFALGLSPEVVVEGIQRVRRVPGRLEKIENPLGVLLLVDYAHTPDALEKVLEALRELMPRLREGHSGESAEALPGRSDGFVQKLICVFGCGGDRDRGKRPLMGEIAARLSDQVVLTSDNPRTEDPLVILKEIEEGVRRTGIKKMTVTAFEAAVSNPKFDRGYWIEPDRRQAIRMALNWASRGDLVLIAGKGHEDYQILGSERIHFDDREVAREEAYRIARQI
jgi:UDP-N-acetylmuramoyl-L-alanyl-D-glutamate--2,6-diaminopimelate ligase